MEYGKKILNEVLKEVREMTSEEYDRLHEEACLYPDVEGMSGADFMNEVTFSHICHMELSEFVYKTGSDVNNITVSTNLNVSAREITLDRPDSNLAKAA